MKTTDRRTFLKLMGAPALAAAVPASMSRALEIPANDSLACARRARSRTHGTPAAW
jgi:phospholipase C